MYCEKCGTKNSDDASFCKECGSKMQQSNAMQDEQPAVPNQKDNNYKRMYNEMPPSTPKWLMIVTIVAVLIAALAVGWLIGSKSLFTRREEPVQEAPGQVEVLTETPIVAPTAEPVEAPKVTVTVEPTADLPEPVEEEVLEQGTEHEIEMTIMPSEGTANYEPAEVLRIREWFQGTEQSSDLIVKENNGVTSYREGATLVKVKLAAGHQSSIYDERLANYLREYFYRDGKIYFAHIHNSDPTGDRFYYVNGQVIRYSPKEGTDYYNADITPYLGLAYSCRTEGEAVFWENAAH